MLTLRPYQQTAISRLYQALREVQRVCLVLPTGSGKRLLAVWLCLEGIRHGRKLLVVTDRRLLVSQMAQECKDHDVHYGVLMADHYEGDPAGPVQIASLHSLESWYLKPGLGTQYGVGLPPADCILIDEGHKERTRYEKLMACYPKAKVVALTATPVGSQGRALCPLPYHELVEPVLNSQLIELGYLLPTIVYAPSEPDIKGVKIENKQEYNQAQLSQRVQVCTAFAHVIQEWQRLAPGRATVVFAPGVSYCYWLAQQFNNHLGAGQAHVIEGKTKPEDRERIIDQVASEQARVIVSVDVLREGFDLPLLSCGIDLQPNSQLRTLWQKLGRVKRKHQDQSQAIWLDFAGNSWRFCHPDGDPEWPTGNATTQEVIAQNRETGKETQPISCPKCFIVYTPSARPPKCPQCGHVIQGTPIKRVRMENGQLVEVPAYAAAKREKSQAEKHLEAWKGKLFAGMYKNWTLSQCAYLFHKETGQWPSDQWPGAASDYLDGKRRVRECLSKRAIMEGCEKILKKLRS